MGLVVKIVLRIYDVIVVDNDERTRKGTTGMDIECDPEGFPCYSPFCDFVGEAPDHLEIHCEEAHPDDQERIEHEARL